MGELRAASRALVRMDGDVSRFHVGDWPESSESLLLRRGSAASTAATLASQALLSGGGLLDGVCSLLRLRVAFRARSFPSTAWSCGGRQRARIQNNGASGVRNCGCTMPCSWLSAVLVGLPLPPVGGLCFGSGQRAGQSPVVPAPPS